jgi:peroxiredoxin
MKKRSALVLLTATFLMTAFVIAGSARNIDNEVPAPPAIGATIEDFTLPDVDGTNRTLASLEGKNGTVLLFIAVQCPVSNAYNERMEKLAQDYKAKGINVIGINSNVSEDAGAVKSHAAENKLTFVILKDPANKIADRLGATKTPEAYLLDANNKLLYHGRIDNSKDPAGVNASELRDAIDLTLSGKPVEKTTATAFGCTIKRA